MFSTPLMLSSKGWITALVTASALAPVYCALTEIVGGGNIRELLHGQCEETDGTHYQNHDGDRHRHHGSFNEYVSFHCCRSLIVWCLNYRNFPIVFYFTFWFSLTIPAPSATISSPPSRPDVTINRFPALCSLTVTTLPLAIPSLFTRNTRKRS